ncbi:hypothetical protein FGO68_gene12981 [Halteria grandinella]|uniref:Uncharacterized protein n=1 Tax=Halteria grandinella TaxID=5974 RepID=A0A8J8NHJ8_HALGN|nr:hypothetical protein FGO68_gene12981 [Halteria grandinella]
MIQMNEIIHDLSNILQNKDVSHKIAQEFIMHSFIAGVCFERLPQKSREIFRETLTIISSFKNLFESKMMVEKDLWAIYEKVANQNKEVLIDQYKINKLYYQIIFQQEISRDTQEFYTSRPKQQEMIKEQQQFQVIILGFSAKYVWKSVPKNK